MTFYPFSAAESRGWPNLSTERACPGKPSTPLISNVEGLVRGRQRALALIFAMPAMAEQLTDILLKLNFRSCESASSGPAAAQYEHTDPVCSLRTKTR